MIQLNVMLKFFSCVIYLHVFFHLFSDESIENISDGNQ